ncbi:MAG: sigma-70 family RNA polymerase sigma factor [Bacteroidota bacterium]|nr:sigma-70 family RNA polymerase sigma factor [Bacteroidota bacterium]
MDFKEYTSRVLPVKDKLFRLANRMVCHNAEAEDIVQETLIRLWNKRNNLHKYRSIEAFAVVITKNLCLDYLKSKKSKTVELTCFNSGKTDVDPYKETETKDVMSLVKTVIDQLPDKQKIVLQLRDIEGKEFDEIVEITGESLNTIRVTLSRARKKVKEAIIRKESYEYKRN